MRVKFFSQEGLTLPELMIGIFILAVGIGGLMISFINCLWLNEQAAYLTTATAHAEYVLEEVRDTQFLLIPTKDWDAWIQSAGLNTLPQESISVLVAGTDPLTVTVSVNWVERGRSRTESFITEVTQ